MAFPNEQVTPANVNVAFNYSNSAEGILNDLLLSFIPGTPAGTPFDLTAASGYALFLDNGLTPGAIGYVSTSVAAALTSHSSTGGSSAVTAANLTTAFALLNAGGRTNGTASLTATDGTNTILAAKGSWSASLVP